MRASVTLTQAQQLNVCVVSDWTARMAMVAGLGQMAASDQAAQCWI